MVRPAAGPDQGISSRPVRSGRKKLSPRKRPARRASFELRALKSERQGPVPQGYRQLRWRFHGRSTWRGRRTPTCDGGIPTDPLALAGRGRCISRSATAAVRHVTTRANLQIRDICGWRRRPHRRVGEHGHTKGRARQYRNVTAQPAVSTRRVIDTVPLLSLHLISSTTLDLRACRARSTGLRGGGSFRCGGGNQRHRFRP